MLRRSLSDWLVRPLRKPTVAGLRKIRPQQRRPEKIVDRDILVVDDCMLKEGSQ
jgi:hypothetical protein